MPLGRLAWGVVLLFISLGQAVSGPAKTSGDEQSSYRYSFRVESPTPSLTPRENGSIEIEIEGFGTPVRRPGAPDLPTRTYLVAIPPGVAPRLEVRVAEQLFHAGKIPRPTAERIQELDERQHEKLIEADADPALRSRVLSDASREVRRQDPAIYQGAQLFPRQIAWLGETGVLRDQRYVEVHVSPFRWDPIRRGLREARGIELTVHFAGSSAEATAEPRVDRVFESVYADSFANYEQGREFRLSRFRNKRGPAPAAATPDKARTPSLRITIRESGIVRLDHAAIGETAIGGRAISEWRLTCRGVPVPLEIHEDGDDWLEAGEWVQFYGEPLLGEPKTILNHDFEEPRKDLYAAGDFTDDNVYILSLGESPPAPIESRDAAPGGVGDAPPYFEATVNVQQDNAYRPLGREDPWYWLPTLVATSSPTSRVETVELPGLYSPTMPLELRVQVRGTSSDDAVDPDHDTRVTLRNSFGEELLQILGAFDGTTVFLHEMTWDGGGPAQATATVDVELEALQGEAQRNDFILDYIDVTYPRAFTAIDEQLIFQWPNETIEFEVDGLLDGSPAIYELETDPSSGVAIPVRLVGGQVSGAGNHTVRFAISADPAKGSAPRTFLVAGDDASSVPASDDIEPLAAADLKDPSIQADIVVIAHPDLLDNEPGSALASLLSHRASSAGGGYSSIVVSLNEVYDTFHHGISGPDGIREFFRWILSDADGEGWADPKPTFAMLLGDGSLDYKGGTAEGSFVPTQLMFKEDPVLGYYASDNLMAAVIGDDPLADLLIGRIPGRSLEQIEMVLTKILDYETAPPPGPWRRHTVLFSDRGSSSGEGNLDFETTHGKVEALICSAGTSTSLTRCPGPEPFTTRHIRYYSELWFPNMSTAPDLMRQMIKDAVNGVDGYSDGAAIVQYAGHGNFVLWSNDAYFDERFPAIRDSEDLVNGDRLPFMMAHNCLTGGFHITAANNVAESWLHREGGGAVGVFSPTGLSFNYIGNTVSDVMYRDWFGNRRERTIAAPVLKVLTKLCTQGSIEPCQHYALLTDPALQLVLPWVDPASQVVAAAGNAEVELSWTASSTPGVTYDVYRSPSVIPSQLNYVLLNDSPIAGTTFTDDDVLNAWTYYYYVIARDPEGVLSAWSNFNSDCDAGPDCVSAVPLNPDPPIVPTGLTLHDPGAGTQINVSWNANPEDDIAHYTLYFGTAPGDYSSAMIVETGTSAGVGGLDEGVVYYFALSATNTSSLTSEVSDEQSDFPVFAPGLRAPRFIDDLAVRVSGADLELSWEPVTVDIYGKPVNVVTYEVFRGSGSDYRNDSLVKIGECVSPCPAFLDVGAAIAPGNAHYRVRAVSDTALRSGLGAEFPRSTELRLSKDLTTGMLLLDWDPVDAVFGGAKVALQHYAVHMSETPFSVAQILDGTVPAFTTTQETSLAIPLPAEVRYYSVVAVDTLGQISPY